MNDSYGAHWIIYLTLALSLAVMGYAIRSICRSSLFSERRNLDVVIVFYTAILLALAGMLAVSQKALCWL